MALRIPLSALSFLAVSYSFAGCGSGTTSLPGKLPDTGAASVIYVAQQINGVGIGSILEFSALANGVVQPIGSLTPPAKIIVLEGLTVDNTSGQIYAGGFTTSPTNTIYQFAREASGLAMPTETLSVSGGNPGVMVVDPAGNLYVGSGAEIDVFSPNGGPKPVRVIAGSSTQLSGVNGIALDAQGNIFVTNGITGPGAVLVFAAAANGNAAPSRTITGVGGAQFYLPSGIAVDPAGNVFVASYLQQTGSSSDQPSSIFEFAPGTSGFGTPIATISGPLTGLTGISSLKFDGAVNLYALVISRSGQPSVAVFSRGTNGNVAPLRSFSSPSWTGTGYGQIGLY